MSEAPGRSTNNYRLTWSECEKNATYFRSCYCQFALAHIVWLLIVGASLSFSPYSSLDNFNSWWWIVVDHSRSNYKSYKQQTTGCCLQQKRGIGGGAEWEEEPLDCCQSGKQINLVATDSSSSSSRTWVRTPRSASSLAWLLTFFEFFHLPCSMFDDDAPGAWSVNDLWRDVASRCLISRWLLLLLQCGRVAPTLRLLFNDQFVGLWSCRQRLAVTTRLHCLPACCPYSSSYSCSFTSCTYSCSFPSTFACICSCFSSSFCNSACCTVSSHFVAPFS